VLGVDLSPVMIDTAPGIPLHVGSMLELSVDDAGPEWRGGDLQAHTSPASPSAQITTAKPVPCGTNGCSRFGDKKHSDLSLLLALCNLCPGYCTLADPELAGDLTRRSLDGVHLT
jgi:hypothetical protein